MLVHVTVSPWAILSNAGENVKLPVISTVKSAPTAGTVPTDKRTSPAHRPRSVTFFVSIFLDVRQTKGRFCSRLNSPQSIVESFLSVCRGPQWHRRHLR